MSEPRTEAAIVLPSYGRPDHLRGCLAALGQLEGGPYPTIVVDDGSPEPLAPICAAAGDWVTCIRQENTGPATARNRGVRAAEGQRLILFTDDDCRPRPDWARRLIAAQAGDRSRLVGGAVVNGLDENAFSGASQAILSYSYRHFGDFGDRLSFFTTNNLCIDRDAFLEMGGFDTGYDFASEDRDLSFRWRFDGGNLHYAPDAVVLHYHRLGFRSFLCQHFSYGRGARRFHRRVVHSGADGVRMGKPQFYAGLLLHPLRRPSSRALVRTTLIGLAHAALAAGYVAERRSEQE